MDYGFEHRIDAMTQKNLFAPHAAIGHRENGNTPIKRNDEK